MNDANEKSSKKRLRHTPNYIEIKSTRWCILRYCCDFPHPLIVLLPTSTKYTRYGARENATTGESFEAYALGEQQKLHREPTKQRNNKLIVPAVHKYTTRPQANTD